MNDFGSPALREEMRILEEALAEEEAEQQEAAQAGADLAARQAELAEVATQVAALALADPGLAPQRKEIRTGSWPVVLPPSWRDRKRVPRVFRRPKIRPNKTTGVGYGWAISSPILGVVLRDQGDVLWANYTSSGTYMAKGVIASQNPEPLVEQGLGVIENAYTLERAFFAMAQFVVEHGLTPEGQTSPSPRPGRRRKSPRRAQPLRAS